MGKLMQEAMKEFTVEKFWKVGILCFLIIASMGMLGLIMDWTSIPWYTKVGTSFTVIFQLALAYLFYWLLKKNNQVEDNAVNDLAKQLETDEDMIRLIDNMKVKKPLKGGNKKNGKKTK